MDIELVPLATLRIQLRSPHVLRDTPMGTRMIFEAASGELEGERLKGSLKGQLTGDWLVLGPERTGTLDVRGLLETHDGALVYMHYLGRTDLGGGPTSGWVYGAPLFETGDERYAWLNKILAIAKGSIDANQLLTYELYEVR